MHGFAGRSSIRSSSTDRLARKRLLVDREQIQSWSPIANHGSRLELRSPNHETDLLAEGVSADTAQAKRSEAFSISEERHKSLDEDDHDLVQPKSKHLVRTLSDLPKFVTVGGFRVASYTIEEEPYLCLPNLIQFMQHKYPLSEIIDAFEKTVTNFKSATPKQVEGFIKAIALPLGAKDCPMIRISDAERVCQLLYERYPYDQTDDSIIDRSKSPGNQLADKNCSQAKSFTTTSIDSHLREGEAKNNHPVINIPHQMLFDDTSYQSLSQHTYARLKHNHASMVGSKEGHSFQDVALISKELRLSMKSTNDKQTLNSDYISEANDSETDACRVFGNDDHNAILNLARAATSTLRIKVYHRCFGKCSGLYYPAKLEDSSSKCIECTVCHQLLNPKRFVLHTHGSKEDNVCHWGFNPNYWRHYIHLYRNQNINNLAEDELLVQVNRLRTIPDKDSEESNGSKLSDQNDAGLYQSRMNNRNEHVHHDKSNHIRVSQEFGKSVPSYISNMKKPVSLSQKQSAIRHNYPIGFMGQTMLDRSTSEAPISSILEKLANQRKHSPLMWPSNVAEKSVVSKQTPNANGAGNAPFYNLSADPLLFTQYFDQSFPISSHMNLKNLSLPQLETPAAGNLYDLMNETASKLPKASNVTDKLFQQDIFVSSSLANYLSSKRLDGNLVRDIVEQTLNIIRKSRMLF